MNGKNFRLLAWLLFLLTGISAFAQPSLSDLQLDTWNFNNTNWFSDSGFPPLSFTNLDNPTNWDGNALQVDSTNVAWLQYSLVESNGFGSSTTNLTFNVGSIELWVLPDWNSGTGPGDSGRLIDVGEYSTNNPSSWWSLYVNATGTSLYFSSETNGVFTNYLNYPISWNTNTWHFLALTYDSSESQLYVDGQLATNGAGVFYLPATNVTGFYVGSDVTGLAQIHGRMDDLATYNYVIGTAEITNDYGDGLLIMGTDYSNSTPPFPSGNLDSGTGMSGGAAPDYGTNLWIAQVGVVSNILTGIASNTVADVSYELMTNSVLTTTNWGHTGNFILGSEITNWTTLNALPVSLTNNLFFQLLSYADSTGTGIPDWWWLQYLGQDTNVDPYADPTGDGYTLFEDFQNGWNSDIFITPPAPQGFTANYDPSNGAVTLNWQPSPGPITGYILGKFDYQTYQGTNIQLSASTVSFDDSVAGDVPSSYSVPLLYVNYSLQAQYGTNGNSASASASLENAIPPTVNLVTGPQGRLWLDIPAAPSDLSYVQIYRKQVGSGANNGLDFAAVDSWYAEDDTIYDMVSPLPDGYFEIPASSVTNGICELPDSQVPPFFAYTLWAQTVRSNGIASGWANLTGYNLVANTPFIDARQQLKDNLRFLLRAATDDSPFAFAVNEGSDDWYLPAAFACPYANYAYSGFYGQGSGEDAGYFNVMHPIHANCFYRNFVFDPDNLDATGLLNTGCSGGGNYIDITGEYNLPCLNITNFPTYYFNLAGYLTNNVAIPASQITTDETQWILPNDGGVASLGGGTFPVGEQNFYGLTNLIRKYAYVTNDQQVLATFYPGDSLPSGVNGVQYNDTAQPIFTSASYYFARPNMDPMPEEAGFATTNVTPTIIVGVGNSQQIAGYAQFGIENGFSGEYAYLGQYFTNAFEIDTNGNVTTNGTGVLSPFGNFLATQPGTAALLTMPDVDTGQQGTCTVSCVSLQLDANHDGIMDLSFNGTDATSQSSPMEFWVNNRYFSADQGDLMAGNGVPTDYSLENMTGQRDLENFARLWVCGIPVLTNGYQVTLSWTNVNSGTPGINLYNSVETNGGTGYLTDTNIAFQQSTWTYTGDSPYDLVKTGAGAAIAEITNGATFTFPSDYFTNGGNDYFLFEGAGIGAGELELTITDNNGNLVAQTGVWLDLHDVGDFYEQVHTANTSSEPPSTNTSVLVEDQILPANPTEDQQAIVFVHGLNVGYAEYRSESETMFRRLYWQGYQGRFAAFDWPSPLFSLLPTGTNEISYYGFNTGEYISWQSGAALMSYIDDLRNRLPGYTINLAAHSLGNVAANEAIREGAQVDNYALMQAAISAGAFDGNNTNLIYDYLAATASSSPDADSLGGYNNCATNQCRRVNFYNDDDFALYEGVVSGITVHTWEGNQLDYKPDTYIYFGNFNYSYSFDGTNCFYTQRNLYGDAITNRLVTEYFEKKSYVARSRTKAVGAAGLAHDPFALTGGVISTNVSLQDTDLGFVGGASFGNTRPEHSGEFTKPIQDTTPFYFQLLKTGFQLQPKLTP